LINFPISILYLIFTIFVQYLHPLIISWILNLIQYAFYYLFFSLSLVTNILFSTFYSMIFIFSLLFFFFDIYYFLYWVYSYFIFFHLLFSSSVIVICSVYFGTVVIGFYLSKVCHPDVAMIVRNYWFFCLGFIWFWVS
jgi:hypothetical protein